MVMGSSEICTGDVDEALCLKSKMTSWVLDVLRSTLLSCFLVIVLTL